MVYPSQSWWQWEGRPLTGDSWRQRWWKDRAAGLGGRPVDGGAAARPLAWTPIFGSASTKG